MEENAGDDESEFDSVTSSQKSFLKNCPFTGPRALQTESSDGGVIETNSDSTEVIANPISPPAVRTPVLSFSTPSSLDSINDEVFRTPPENASLSSAADSEPRVSVSELKESLKWKPNSASPSLAAENVRVLEMKRFPSPPSVAADDARMQGKHRDPGSPSPSEIKRTRVLENQPISASVGNTGVPKSPSPARGSGENARDLNLGSSVSATEIEIPGGEVPFREIIEALLRNGGENLEERYEDLSYVEILKRRGLRFP